MNVKKLLGVALCAAVFSTALADQAFRDHRYDSFKATPTEPGQIVFAGNSITNMHSWFEAFGSHQEVIGRGNSGGFAYELLDNLENYIDSKPSKFFVMIGTNDVSSGQSAEITAKRIETIARRVRLESPETEVYVQSILPRSSNPKPDYENCNALVSAAVAAMGDEKVHFINLSEVCAPINGNTTWAYDGLHPRPIGYSAWTHHIEDMVGYPSVYPVEVTSQDNCGAGGNSNGGRVEQFPYYPISEGDVLFFGDEQVHGGEWHELLRSNKVKDRGLCWGWGGVNLTVAKNIVASSLKDQANKPAKIFLFYGIGGQDLTNYRAVVDEAKAQAPNAEIYLVSLTPSTNADTDATRVSFNTSLQTIAAEKGATYVDVYTPLNAELAQNIMNTNYVTGRGYIVMANELAKHISDANPVSLAEYDAVYALRSNRKIIGDALTSALMLTYGDKPGLVKEAHRAEIEAAVNDAVAIVNNADLTAEQATAKAQAVNQAVAAAYADINLPTASTVDAPVWYTLTSARGSKALIATDGALFGAAKPVTTSLGYDIWQFISRGDGTYDIRNANGEYVNPVASHNNQMTVMTTAPERGFSLSYSNNGLGNYVIYTSNSQLNQTSQDNKVFNWYGTSTPNRDDQGCAYALAEYDGIVIDPELAPVQSGWYEIKDAATQMPLVNMDNVFRDTNTPTNSYSMQYVAATSTLTPKNWVYIDVDGDTRKVQLLNGFFLGVDQTNKRSAADQSMTASVSTPGAYDVRYWVAFTRNGNNPANVLGRSSNATTPHFFRHVQPSELEQYDIWTVKIAANPGTEEINDTHVTLASEGLHSIATVYNYGTYFLAPGTTFTASDLTITPPAGVEQDNEVPAVEIDSANKEIRIIYSGEIIAPETDATEPLAAGWYVIKLTGHTGTNASAASGTTTAVSTNANTLFAADNEYHQALNGGHHYYHIGIGNASELADPAQTFFYVESPSLEVLNLQSQNGHHTLANGTATRSKTNLALSGLTTYGNASIPLCIWTNNNIGAPHNLVGLFSNNSSTFNFTPANLDTYDVYSVSVIGETPADAIVDDVKITLNSEANKGLQSVYNGGSFFVTKGAAITPEMVSAPEHAGNTTPLVTVENGAITVDYTQTLTGITELTSDSNRPAEVYDLWGRRARTPRHGLYIVNGQKVRI